jgi:hypothetical protein
MPQQTALAVVSRRRVYKFLLLKNPLQRARTPRDSRRHCRFALGPRRASLSQHERRIEIYRFELTVFLDQMAALWQPVETQTISRFINLTE